MIVSTTVVNNSTSSDTSDTSEVAALLFILFWNMVIWLVMLALCLAWMCRCGRNASRTEDEDDPVDEEVGGDEQGEKQLMTTAIRTLMHQNLQPHTFTLEKSNDISAVSASSRIHTTIDDDREHDNPALDVDLEMQQQQLPTTKTLRPTPEPTAAATAEETETAPVPLSSFSAVWKLLRQRPTTSPKQHQEKAQQQHDSRNHHAHEALEVEDEDEEDDESSSSTVFSTTSPQTPSCAICLGAFRPGQDVSRASSSRNDAASTEQAPPELTTTTTTTTAGVSFSAVEQDGGAKSGCWHVFHTSCLIDYATASATRYRQRRQQQHDESCRFVLACPLCRQPFLTVPAASLRSASLLRGPNENNDDVTTTTTTSATSVVGTVAPSASL